VNLTGIAKEVTQILRRDEPERKVQFMFRRGATIEGDARLLRVVLENLLGNAWKFTAKQKQACIKFGYLDKPPERIFFVSDDGAGFDANYADKLFKPFQRLHSPHEFEGTGIGLATVRRIIERHGGKVSAQGVVGKGARICFTLPVYHKKP
jgi:signal transduction histidine kinase